MDAQANAQLTMTQVVLTKAGGPEQLVVEHPPIPEPGPGQVLVQVEAAGVAFNDITARQGRNPGALARVLGFDVVGNVVKLGSEVTSLHPGQRIAALLGTGGYSSYVAVDVDRAVAVRSDVDAAQLDALVLNYVTAWQMLHRAAKVQAGQTVFLRGAAGGVGSALLELAHLAGLTVYGATSPSRRTAVEAAGGHWVAAAADLPVKVDAVFDPVGGPSLRESRRVTRPGGIVVSYGFSFAVGAGHSKYVGLARTAAALGRAKITPGPKVTLFQVDAAARKDPGAYREDLTTLVDLLAEGRIHPVVSTMPLVDAAQAHRRLEAREVVGKLVLLPGGVA